MPPTTLISYPPAEPEALAERTGKFVQLVWRDQPYLLFATFQQHRYHNQILARFLAEHEIAHHWPTPLVLSVDAPELEVIGGGRFRADPARGVLELWDDSQVYGRFDERLIAGQVASAEHPYGRLRVEVR